MTMKQISEVVDEIKISQLGGGVRVVNCSILGFYFGYDVGTSGYVSGSSCITNCRIGVHVFRTANVYGGYGKYLNSQQNVQCSQLGTFSGGNAYFANSGGVNVRGLRGASIYITNGAKVINSGATAVVLSRRLLTLELKKLIFYLQVGMELFATTQTSMVPIYTLQEIAMMP